MIHLEVIHSPDSDVLFPFEFFQNQIHLGKKTGNLVIKDSGLLNNHLMIEVVENDLLVHPQKEVEFFLINGKRATNVRKIKSGDVLTIGETQIKILNFKQTETITRKDVLTQKLNILMEENSPRLSVIEKLTALSK